VRENHRIWSELGFRIMKECEHEFKKYLVSVRTRYKRIDIATHSNTITWAKSPHG
jgi:hypothetical protein